MHSSKLYFYVFVVGEKAESIKCTFTSPPKSPCKAIARKTLFTMKTLFKSFMCSESKAGRVMSGASTSYISWGEGRKKKSWMGEKRILEVRRAFMKNRTECTTSRRWIIDFSHASTRRWEKNGDSKSTKNIPSCNLLFPFVFVVLFKATLLFSIVEWVEKPFNELFVQCASAVVKSKRKTLLYKHYQQEKCNWGKLGAAWSAHVWNGKWFFLFFPSWKGKSFGKGEKKSYNMEKACYGIRR